MPAKVVAVGPTSCRPFLLDVMVFSPEAGFKFDVQVEKDCTPTNNAVWKIVFDLFQKNSTGSFDQIVHVSFTAGNAQEAKGVQSMALEGVSSPQADLLTDQVHPAAKEFAVSPTPQNQQKVEQAIQQVALAGASS